MIIAGCVATHKVWRGSSRLIITVNTAVRPSLRNQGGEYAGNLSGVSLFQLLATRSIQQGSEDDHSSPHLCFDPLTGPNAHDEAAKYRSESVLSRAIWPGAYA